MKQSFFMAADRMADLVLQCHKLLLVIPRFGIPFGYGDKNVAQVCEEYHVHAALLLDVSNMYAFEQFRPALHDIDRSYLEGLTAYLLASHHYYLDERIPHIGQHLGRVANVCVPRYGDTLRRFYDEYRQEVTRHFAYEEEVAFPYVRTLLDGGNTGGYTMEQYRANHTNIEDKLEDLTHILIKYLPGDILPDERTSILFDLFNLSSDVLSHTRIEEHLMIPAVEALEKKRR